MLYVVLDTSILHQEGLNSRAMKLLGRLAVAQEVSIYVPDLVRREFTSRRIAEGLLKLRSVTDAAKEIGKVLPSEGSLLEDTQKLLEAAAQLRDGLKQAVDAAFDEWALSGNVTIVAVPPNAITAVLDAYFDGTGGFRKPKNRDDFPDAFIASAVRSIEVGGEPLHVITKDGALRHHFSTIPQTVTLSGLADLLEAQEVRQIIERLDARDSHVDSIKAAMATTVFRDQVVSYLREHPALFEEAYLEADQIRDVAQLSLPGFGHSLDFISYDGVAPIELRQSSFVGADRYSLEISLDASAKAFYCADYARYVDLPEEAKSFVEEVSFDEGIVDIEERVEVRLHGHVMLQLKESLTARELEIAARSFEVNMSSVVIDVEIETAEVKRPVWHVLIP